MIIDAHLHLWDTERHRYEWLLRPGNEALNRPFGFGDFAARAASAGVDAGVLVQADDAAADTEMMFEVARARASIAGVVGWVPLDRPEEAARALEGLCGRPKFAGIRALIHDQPDPDWLLRPSVDEGLGLLEDRGVPFDVVAVLPRHLAHVPVLSQRHPRLPMVLDHLAHPPLGHARREDWEPWRSLLRAAAENPLVHAKVSGLYPPRPDWDAGDIRPYVEYAVEVFGAERLMAGSDWPVAEQGGGYQRVWGAVARVIGELPEPSREAMLGGTARRFYGLP
ncbi:MAG: amidohydrolase family protein [Nocardiopsaceae bacterium]|nr:amidohydrolase family protein [Nocardiopsaceae bacterium]